MKKVLAIKNVKGVDVALIHWAENTCTPYVVAWNCSKDKIENGYFTGSWGQGHYCCTLRNAIDCYLDDYDNGEDDDMQIIDIVKNF